MLIRYHKQVLKIRLRLWSWKKPALQYVGFILPEAALVLRSHELAQVLNARR